MDVVMDRVFEVIKNSKQHNEIERMYNNKIPFNKLCRVIKSNREFLENRIFKFKTI